MKSTTHCLVAVTVASTALGTVAWPHLLAAGLASQLPDLDTSTSWPGRILKPIAVWIEKRYPHRTITHSFFASGLVAVLSSPLLLVDGGLFWCIVLGFTSGWFSDAFTKQGVCAFWPSSARLVVPANPHLRLGSGSPAEWVVVGLCVAVMVVSISIQHSGGISQTLNQWFGIPSGAVEIVNEQIGQRELWANFQGLDTRTQQSTAGRWRIIQSLSETDLLTRNDQNQPMRIGQSRVCQVLVSSLRVETGRPASIDITQIALDGTPIIDLEQLNPTSYLNGELLIEENVIIPTSANTFPVIRVQNGDSVASIEVIGATPQEVVTALGDYDATGTLTVRAFR